MNELGERIKKYRKEKKLTLAQLAGDRLTKGMLSLIENGKAQPSMESLHYIAEQLGVDVATLLHDKRIEEYRALLLELEEEFVQIKQDPDDAKIITKVLQRIEPILTELQGQSYEEIRLQELYTQMRHYEGDYDKQAFLEIIDRYEQIHAYSRMIKGYFYLCWKEFGEHHYEQALEYLVEAERRAEPYQFLVDDLSKLDLYYNLTVMYLAVDDEQNAEHYLQQALSIAKTKKIYYRLDDFYRLLFVQAVGKADAEKAAYYLRKLTLLVELSEDDEMHMYVAYCELHFTTMIERNYDEVESKLVEIKAKASGIVGMELSGLFECEQVYAYYRLGRFADGIEAGKEIQIPSYIHHPIDLVIFYRFYAVRALCYVALGNIEAAKRDILYAKNGAELFPPTSYKEFIEQAYKGIIG